VRRAVLAAVALLLLSSGIASTPSAETVSELPLSRFRAVDVIIDSEQPVAAYQVEITVRTGESAIVGVEGGVAPFDEPPYYDPAALSQDRIILASFDTRATIPAGRHRVATLHVREVGAEAEYDIQLVVSADLDGQRGSATASLEARKAIP
jgi:hypothetical protein